MDVENGVTDKAEPTHRHFQSVGNITGENRFHWRLGEVGHAFRTRSATRSLMPVAARNFVAPS